MKIGRLEIRWIKHKKKKASLFERIYPQKKPSLEHTCDICGEHCSREGKGFHIMGQHPEYQITQEQIKVDDSWGSHKYRIYHCGFCDYKHATPSYVVRHIRESHATKLKQKIKEL